MRVRSACRRRPEHRRRRAGSGCNGPRSTAPRGWSGNVEEIDDAGKATVRYCIHPTIGVPHPDNQLAQKLMLEHDEAGFRKVACATPLSVARTAG